MNRQMHYLLYHFRGYQMKQASCFLKNFINGVVLKYINFFMLSPINDHVKNHQWIFCTMLKYINSLKPMLRDINEVYF